MRPDATPAYADVPRSGSGPGVLVLHSWWGLTEACKDRVNHLADAGFTALAPDLFEGETARDDVHGRELLTAADPNKLVLGIEATANALRRMPATIDGPIMIVGYSMGGSLGLWFSERHPDDVSAVVSYYGTQGIDFTETASSYLLHMASGDEMLDPDELALMEASLGLAGRPVELHDYDGVRHNFAEAESPNHDPEAAATAWARTIDFLDRNR